MAIGRKTGGKVKGVSKHKPKTIKLPDTEENRALVLMAPTAEIRTPKAVMLDAMHFFDQVARDYHEQKQPEKAAKYMAAAVNVAEKVAPYIHARLMAIESRGDNVDQRAPFVIRAPAVMADSSTWQAAVGSAVVEMEASQSPSGGRTEVLAHPAQSDAAQPPNAPATAPVRLTADQATGRVTIMPPGPRVVQPSGTQEWLDSIKKTG